MIVNNDYHVTHNSIHAKQTSLSQFKALIHQAFLKIPLDFREDDDGTVEQYIILLFNEEDLDELPRKLHPFASKIPYQYQIDNASTYAINKRVSYFQGKHLEGFRMLPNGIPILGIYASSDYGSTAMYIIYPNQNGHLDIYVPIRGNAVNLANKAIIGESLCDIPTDDASYLQKYGLTEDTLYLDGTAMLNELLQAISVHP